MQAINEISSVRNWSQYPRQVLSRKPAPDSPLIRPLTPCCPIVKTTQHKPDRSASKKIDKILSNMDEDIVHIQNTSADGGYIHASKREQSPAFLIVASGLFKPRGVQYIVTFENKN